MQGEQTLRPPRPKRTNRTNRTNRRRTFPPEVLTQVEVMALMAACSSGLMGIRNWAMIAVWRERRASIDISPTSTDFCMADGRLRGIREARSRAQAAAQARGGAADRASRHRGHLEAVGHRSIATTARYLDHVAPFAVVKAMRAR